ncbi:NAD(P)H-dependent oxidoreductase [Leucobacter soli]
MTEHTAPTSGSALWVYAHPRATSLNARLFRAGREALAESRSVAISDFYAQRFDPVLRISDLGDASDTPGSIVEQAGAAYASGTLPVDIREEQRKLTEAELLVLQFPLWWFGVPAILKGWFDRVFTDGFAFGGTDPELGVPRRYGDGPLAGRRALIVVTAGEDPGSIGARGISGDLESLLFP